jgi:succinoglycan biosynthesis transport protein ExoP
MTDKTIILPNDPSGNGSDALYRLTMMMPKRRYPSYLRERWWVVLVCVVLALSGIMTFETLRAPSYRSYAELYTSSEVQLGVASLFNEESQTYYGTQIELIKSSRLQNAAFERMGYTPKAGEKLPVLDVSRPQSTALLQLQATGSDPLLTQRFLQALIDAYLDYKKETRRSTSEDIISSLTDQLAAKEKDLKAEQEKWTEFQRSNNVAVLVEESRSAGLYLSDLNLELAKLKLDGGLLAAGLSPAPSDTADTSTNQTGQVADAGAQLGSTGALLQSARVELAVLLAEQQHTIAEHGEGAARRMTDAVTNLEQRVTVLEKQDLTDKKADLDRLQKRMSAVETSIPVWEEKVLNLNERLAEAERLKNNIAREQSYYDHLLATLQNVDLSRNVQPERLSMLQAPTSAAPVLRYLPLRMALALAFGVFAGLGLVFCWYMLDDRFVSVRDVKDQFGEVVLGLVPQVKVSRSQPEQALLQTNDSRVAYAESFRHLRSALLLSSGGEKRPQTLLFTGAAPAEGKTTVAMNLARVMATAGLRVALIDADSHNGRMHKLFGAENELGLLDFLRGEAGAKAVVHPTSVPGLEFVPIGTRPSESDGIFLRPGLENLLDELKTGRDFLILDGPPILAADDAALFVPHADAVVMVVRPFFSSSRLVRQALDMLYQRQAKQVAIIFNQARKDDLAGHYADRGRKQSIRNGTVAKP